jgi:putative ATP-dependent endonuclease of OLD family
MIRIHSVAFKNFRTLQDVSVPLGRSTILVGQNNAGKTSVLQGLELSLGLGRRAYGFDERDVTEGVDPTTGFEIRIELEPVDGPTFDADEVALFGNHVDVVGGEHRIFVVAAGRLEADEGIFRTRLRFAKSDGVEDGSVSLPEREALGVLVLPAIREARHEFGERGGLWARLGGVVGMTPEARDQLADVGLDVGRQVVDAALGAEVSREVTESVAGLLTTVLYADEAEASVEYSVLPTDLAQVLRSVEVRVASPHQPSGRRVGDQSAGTQSVAMFGLFDAFAHAAAANVMAVGIEEPEAHLHPHATRRVVRHLDDLQAQIIITTHSTSVTDAADPRSIVRLRRRGQATTAHSAMNVGISDIEARTIGKLVSDVGSDFVFARAVLLTEGSSERLAIPQFARQLGVDFDVLGISLVPVLGGAFRSFARLLGPNGLAIPFALVADLDAATNLVRMANAEGILDPALDDTDLAAGRAAAQAAGVFWWSAGDFEASVMDNRGGPAYVDALAELYGPAYLNNVAAGARIPLPADPGTDPGFLRRALRGKASKPLVAQRVAELFADRAMPVPQEIADVIEFVAELARAEVRLAVAAPDPDPA